MVNGHNWVANPKSRIGGLGRTAPCPPRVGKSLHIAVRQGETFPIEWSDGHPGSFIYYTMAVVAVVFPPMSLLLLLPLLLLLLLLLPLLLLLLLILISLLLSKISSKLVFAVE